MKRGWKNYLLYSCEVFLVGGLIYILVETLKAKNTGFETKTLWDWMDLLVVPLVLALGAFLLNRSERESDRQRAEGHAMVEREIATDRQREAALQAYIDRMADLLIKDKLRTTKNKEIRNVARTRTLTVLRGLDSNRKALLIQFLVEAKLIDIRNPVIELNNADLSGANLVIADLNNANLSQVNLTDAKLNGANLSNVNLCLADLSYADLRKAILKGTNLTYAELDHTILNNTDLDNADLSYANLSNINLRRADLHNAKLRNAILIGANLTDAKVDETKLEKDAYTLEDTIMPDGTKHK